mgnify:CR=1 FL=1
MKALLYKDAMVLWKQMKLMLLLILIFAVIPSEFQNTFAVLYALVREWVNHRLQAKGIDGDGNPILSYAKAEEDTDPPV